MTLARVKTWTSEVLTATDLNAEFNNILNFVNASKIQAVDALTLAEGDQLRYRGSAWANASCKITRQSLLTGTGATYTTPSNCRQLRIRMVGGGGGGGGSGTAGATSGGDGGNTTFNSIVANGGQAGQNNGLGGLGGVSGTGTALLRANGAAGCGGFVSSGTVYNIDRSHGGPSLLGGNTITTAIANSGSGGAGGVINAAIGQSGAGGGSGEYVEYVIDAPSATYTYTIGTAGAAGSAAAGGAVGFAGGTGIIIVDELY